MKYSIGIDIGGTNTDLVLLDPKKRCVCSCKVTTTLPLEIGVEQGLRELIKAVPLTDIEVISIGTTHALNALLSAKSLLPVGLIRIAGHKPELQPGLRWGKDLRSAVLRGAVTINGGFECHGGEITPFRKEEMKQAVETLLDMGAEGFSIISCFGTLYPQHEEEACVCLQDIAGKDIPVTLSHEIGGIGFVERENATLLNTALKDVIGKSFSALEGICRKLGLGSMRLCLVQNDGSQMTVDEAKHKPIQTLGSGPMNSAKGGRLLSGQDSCVVVDIGGTSTDVACVLNGHVKRSGGVVTIADVRMRFPCPDVLSIALGGGSIINSDGNIGPRSVGRELCKASQAFGGSILTLTDLALLLGSIEIPGANLTQIRIEKNQAIKILDKAAFKIAHAVRLVRGENKDLPCVLVGGGALLFQEMLPALLEGVVSLETEQHTGIANAFGAAHSEISGHFDSVISLHNRDQALVDATNTARAEAIRKGADPHLLKVGNLAIEPLAYSSNKLARVIVSVSGPTKG
jgi:N-methylhydantoinase A/oxoprolinase/acetone carboxylase beta subunit